MSNFDEIRRLAEAGDPMSQNRLGVSYGEGRLGMQNQSEASRWLNKSADQGNEAAKNNLAYRYNSVQTSQFSPSSSSTEMRAKVQRGY